MKIKPALGLSLAISSFLFFTSVACLIAQPDLKMLLPLWQASLASSPLLILSSYLINRSYSRKSAAILLLDLIICAAILFLTYSDALGPEFVIRRPLGVGASFSYSFVLPLLVFFASLLCIKDSLNVINGSNARGREALVFLAIRLSAVLSLLLLGGILFIIAYKGIWIINWEFLTTPHRRLGQAGGISTAIMGSLWMVLGAMLVSSPLGIGAAIYLHEYSKSQRLNRLITIAVSCLNGVPSVVFGLFGLAFLVTTFGVSLLSGSIILGLINIPTIILTSQEALKSVPNSLREGSMALGATKWQTIRKVVLPSGMPGILTGVIMGVAKASGETAPIMWTAVTFTATPVQMVYGVIPDVFQPVNNLDYHLLNLIYFLGAWDVESRAWGTALVLIALVLGTNMLAIVVRNHYRKKISW
ncbi:Binding-protein-dependent transport system inner membrane component [uncultured archaeon]|nr:Binding-protein-dependent transport system inner membrane component [uncultured archaeon]